MEERRPPRNPSPCQTCAARDPPKGKPTRHKLGMNPTSALAQAGQPRSLSKGMLRSSYKRGMDPAALSGGVRRLYSSHTGSHPWEVV